MHNGRTDDLAPEVWNAIAGEISRANAPRQIHFVKVTKRDNVRKLIWAEEFGQIAIPLVSFNFTFAWFDTEPADVCHDGLALATKKVKYQDLTQENDRFKVKVVTPHVGVTVVVLDLWGAKRFPVCIGTFLSKEFWEEPQ